MTETPRAPFSESVEMYLVTTTRLREDGQPVPLSQLASTLDVSPVSANEMCHKLHEQGLVIYRPYKGVALTAKGEQHAATIRRRHWLWETFLIEHLDMVAAQAHETACRLEHATPDSVADRLDAFLGHPSVTPEGVPIPGAAGAVTTHAALPLSALSAGQHGHIVRCDVSDAARTFLAKQGVRPGAALGVAAVAKDSVLVEVEQTSVALAWTVAELIQVELEAP